MSRETKNRSTQNVLADLGFPDAEALTVLDQHVEIVVSPSSKAAPARIVVVA